MCAQACAATIRYLDVLSFNCQDHCPTAGLWAHACIVEVDYVSQFLVGFDVANLEVRGDVLAASYAYWYASLIVMHVSQRAALVCMQPSQFLLRHLVCTERAGNAHCCNALVFENLICCFAGICVSAEVGRLGSQQRHGVRHPVCWPPDALPV